MKLTLLQKNLKNGLNSVSNKANKTNNLAILNIVLISAKDNVIKIAATNLEIGITAIVRGKIDAEGAFTIDAKILAESVALLPNEKVDLELKGDELVMTCGGYKTKIKGQSTDEYPLIPEMEQQSYYQLDGKVLKDALTQVLFSCAPADSRAEMTGVMFLLAKDKLTLAATDSYRLAEKSVAVMTNYSEAEQKIIIPARTISELVRLLCGESEMDEQSEVKLSIADGQVLFSFYNLTLISRLIDGQYPDYQQIIPSGWQTTLMINRTELTRTIKLAAIFAKNGVNDINLDLSIEKKTATVFAATSQIGENTTNLPAEISGIDNSVTINYRYLLDVLANLAGENVMIQVVDGNTPCLVSGQGDESYRYIIMPIKK